MTKKHPISIAYGDGIGPEIMEATLSILEASKAPLELHEIAIGEKLYLQGFQTGIDPSMWEKIRKTKAFLKAPITTPQGGGFKSLNVTIRSTLGLYANVRPCVAYFPFVSTKHPKMDVVIVRENEEDLYSGIEYRQTPNVCSSLKIISREGTEKIVRYAFAYAKAHQRKKVSCFAKDNIMKLSDGLFRSVFDEIAQEYPDIESEFWIVDIGAAKLADTPEAFDVIVLPNLYGDILSDVAAQIAGSVGLAGSANIGDHGAMFEAIHGSAPRRAGQNVANPSGLLLAAVQMLVYLKEASIAEQIHNGWLKTLEDGIHTYDIFHEKVSKKRVGTQEFAQAVIERLGEKPSNLPSAHYHLFSLPPFTKKPVSPLKRELVGIDVYLYHKKGIDELLALLGKLPSLALSCKMITNRGARVWPDGRPETFCIDEWRVRFLKKNRESCSSEHSLELLKALNELGIDWIKSEHLYTYDGKAGYSSSEG